MQDIAIDDGLIVCAVPDGLLVLRDVRFGKAIGIGMPLPFDDTEDNRSSLGVRHGGIGLPEGPWESALGRLEFPILGFSELEGREEDIHIEFVHMASLEIPAKKVWL